ncbi:7-carboxy-7-deazaguanine synthase QueE [bacterium]|nr:7-carboxy-7-deazaguanine synthase QueE [bacterium]
MSDKVLINEIFTSVQGEGLYTGLKQLFIRFGRCNLDCRYCDTDFRNPDKNKEYSVEELIDEVSKFDLDSCHSVALTGGEPLLETAFLKEFLPEIGNKKIYLETNGILYYNLQDIISMVDIISMDYKLASATGHESKHDIHRRFINIAKDYQKNIFIKVVFDSNINDEEIAKICELANDTKCFIALQPMMKDGKLLEDINFSVSVMDKFLAKYPNVRLIPQMHTFLGLR